LDIPLEVGIKADKVRIIYHHFDSSFLFPDGSEPPLFYHYLDIHCPNIISFFDMQITAYIQPIKAWVSWVGPELVTPVHPRQNPTVVPPGPEIHALFL
jgi:hypothetical protein